MNLYFAYGNISNIYFQGEFFDENNLYQLNQILEDFFDLVNQDFLINFVYQFFDEL